MLNNIEIENSLIEKKDNIEGYNPEILVNGNFKNIKSKVIRNLDDANKFDIAISYVVWSGLSLIYSKLGRYDNDSRFLVTTEGYVTDPTSLRRLLGLNIQTRVYNPKSNDRGFHLKSYLFTKADSKTLIIGSSNISSRAFGEVHEMAVEIDAENEGKIVSEYTNNFDVLWSDPRTTILTEQFIKDYEKQFYRRKRYEKKAHELLLDEVKIQPNFMQEDALTALKECRRDYDKGLVVAATGTGKTFLSAFDVRQFNANKVLFLVHNRLILKSAKKAYEKIFGSNKTYLELDSTSVTKIDRHDFIFTTDKTAKNHLFNRVSKDYFDYIIYDEAHKIGVDTIYKELLDYFTPKFSLGMTATPERTKDSGYLFEVFEYSVPYEIRLIDSLANKLICPFTYYGFDSTEYEDVNSNIKDYNTFVKGIIGKIDKVGHYGEKLRGIVFCSNQNEAKTVCDEFNSNGIHTEVVISDYSIDDERIGEYIKRLENDNKDDISLLCVVDKFNEGIDIPEVNMIIMLRPTTSSIIFLQQLGRGLRLTSDEHKFVTVLDFIGNNKNNYTIVEALTGRQTANKERLINSLETNFETVSPFINVEIEKIALDKLMNNISLNYKAKTEIRKKFVEEFSKYKYIPDLVELYKDPFFNEMEILQLLYDGYYSAFDSYYKDKYGIDCSKEDEQFLKHFFNVIIQFVFRFYNGETLNQYKLLLEGNSVKSELLTRTLCPYYENVKGYKNPITANYKKLGDDIFILNTSGQVELNSAVIDKVKNLNAFGLYNEHIELIDYLSVREDYEMKLFNLVTKSEFLINAGADDIYMNAVGERLDHNKKVMYTPVTNESIGANFPNAIIDNKHFMYITQQTSTVEQHDEKIRKLLENNYEVKLAVKFPQAKYENTSYFYMGNVKIVEVGETTISENGKYNTHLILELESEIPSQLMQYKKVTDNTCSNN